MEIDGSFTTDFTRAMIHARSYTLKLQLWGNILQTTNASLGEDATHDCRNLSCKVSWSEQSLEEKGRLGDTDSLKHVHYLMLDTVSGSEL